MIYLEIFRILDFCFRLILQADVSPVLPRPFFCLLLPSCLLSLPFTPITVTSFPLALADALAFAASACIQKSYI